MIATITPLKRDLVDKLGASVDSFKFGLAGVEEVLCFVFEIEDWDIDKRSIVKEFVHRGTVMSLEELFDRLGVAVADPT